VAHFDSTDFSKARACTKPPGYTNSCFLGNPISGNGTPYSSWCEISSRATSASCWDSWQYHFLNQWENKFLPPR